MGDRKRYLLSKANKKVIYIEWYLRALMFMLSGIVMYDAVIHKTPLYYIGFFFFGMIVGRVYLFIYSIRMEEEKETFSIHTSPWNLVLALALILTRFVFGERMLESAHVAWSADALYLFFIGLYHAKWRNIVRQIDNLMYRKLAAMKSPERDGE